MGVGRFVFVAVPILLLVASILSMLYATLAGVSHEKLHIFSLNLTNLSISPVNADNLADKVLGIDRRADVETNNITVADLGLADVYDVTLWGWCATDAHGKKTCTPHEFNWASKKISSGNLTTDNGVTIKLPKPVVDAVNAFRTVTNWADWLFVVALVALGVELLVGLGSGFSRAVSCLTWLVSIVTTTFVVAAAGLATAMAVIIVGVVDSTAKWYGVKGQIGTSFIVTVWISAAFAMAASLFWIFTICCCAPDRGNRKSRRRNRGGAEDSEKLLPTPAFGAKGYAPLGEHQAGVTGLAAAGDARYPSGSGRADLAYEPYSHRA